MSNQKWHDLGLVEKFAQRPVTEVHLGRTRVAITHRETLHYRVPLAEAREAGRTFSPTRPGEVRR